MQSIQLHFNYLPRALKGPQALKGPLQIGWMTWIS